MHLPAKKVLQLLVLIGSLALVGCDSNPTQLTIHDNGDGTGSMSLAPPSVLQNTRMVDLDRVRLELRVNGRLVDTVQDDNGDFQSTPMTFDPGTQLSILASWIERLPNQSNQDLELALASINFGVPLEADGDQATVAIEDFRYDTSMDQDNDTLSNLNERENGSNAFDTNNPSRDTINNIPYRLVIKPPAEFINLESAEIQKLRPRVTVNGIILQPIYEIPFSLWSRNSSEEQGNEIFVRITMHRDDTFNEVVGTVARRFKVGGGADNGDITIEPDMYD